MRRLSFLAVALLLFTAACGSSSKTVSEKPAAGGTTATTASSASGGQSYVDPYNTPPAATATTTAPAAAPAGGSSITIQNFAFAPANLTVAAGTTVTVKNMDATGHTWTADNSAFNSPVAPGGTATFTFSTKGTFTYHCNIHPSMTGTVTVN